MNNTLTMHFIDLGQQYQKIKPDVDQRISSVLNHGQYILGPEVSELESKLSQWCGAKHCITVANGTDALQIALMSLDVGVGDEVISPAFTYAATVEACAVLGAVPVLVDVCPDTFLMDQSSVEAAITSKTKAIIPVSLYGQCSDMVAINAIASKYNIPVIEDAAQSFGASQGSLKSCNLSTMACASFFPSKPLGCYGDGGAVFTSNDDLAHLARQIARHGQSKRYHHVRVGVNSRLDTIQAAVLLAKLCVFEEEISARQGIADEYFRMLRDCSKIQLPHIEKGNLSAWAQFTVSVCNRDAVADSLQSQGIPTVIHYPMAINRQIAYRDDSRTFKASDLAAASVLSLPMHPYMTLQDVERVANGLLSSVSFE